jgi:hypothetical protein
MPWVKLDDKFWGNPKVQKIGNEAAGAYCRMLSFCGDHLTDGLITGDALRFICRPKVAEILTEYGFIQPHGEDWIVPDYLDFNPSREQVESKREADRKRRAGE